MNVKMRAMGGERKSLGTYALESVNSAKVKVEVERNTFLQEQGGTTKREHSQSSRNKKKGKRYITGRGEERESLWPTISHAGIKRDRVRKSRQDTWDWEALARLLLEEGNRATSIRNSLGDKERKKHFCFPGRKVRSFFYFFAGEESKALTAVRSSVRRSMR